MKNERTVKINATAFSIAGALLIAALVITVNFITTPQVIWFIYPLFAVAWWPVSVYFCSRKQYLAFSITGSSLIIVFLAVTNLVTSPHFLWFIYGIPPVLFWPVGMVFRKQLAKLPFALVFGAVIIGYFTAVNLLLTPHYFWAIHLVYLTIWWPLCLLSRGKGEYKKLSVTGTLITIVYLSLCNLMTSTFPWALFACYPLIWWPISMYSGKRLGSLRLSIIGAVCTTLWYGALNLLLSASPWIVFIAYAVLWWPLSVFFYGRGCAHWYAAAMTAISIVFLTAVNLLYSPSALWAFYPSFAILWWPMTLFFARGRKWFGYSLAASLLTIAFLVVTNLITSPGFLWSLFPALGILWWPLSVYFAKRNKPFGFSLAGSALAIVLFVSINLLTSPSFLWSLFPALGILWWPLSVYFAKRNKPFAFSLAGSTLAIVLFVSINLLTSPSFLWSMFPAFAILWWPLGVYFHRRKLAHQI